MDVAVFWGYDHTDETDEDIEAFYIAKDGDEELTIDGVGSFVPNYTYLYSGYVRNDSSQSVSRQQEIAAAVEIYDDKINYTLYDKNGVDDSSADFALNVDVVREFAGSVEAESVDIEEESVDIEEESVDIEEESVDVEAESVDVEAESVDVETEEPITVQGTGTISTTSTKTVYVLHSGDLGSGKKYLIANYNSAGTTTRYLLANNNGSIAATGVVIKSGDVDSDGDTEIYIELEDASKELWTTGGSYTFKNGIHYLGTSSSNSLSLGTGSASWSYSNNRLSRSLSTGWWNSNYYLRYNNSKWEINTSTSNANVYFYAPQEIKMTETKVENGIYSITGKPEEIKTAAIAGNKITLESALSFVTENGEKMITDVSGTAKYTVYNADGINGDPDQIIAENGINGNVVTLSGKLGSALLKVTYEDPSAFQGIVTNYIVLTTTESVYTLELHHSDTTVGADGTVTAIPGEEITQPIVIKDVKEGESFKNIWAIIKKDGVDIGKLSEEDLPKLNFISSDTDIANVDSATGIVTFTGQSGRVSITATYEYASGKSVTDTVIFSVSDEHYIIPGDGTEDFPEYPNQGSIRFDKHATAVGRFSQTGITKLELSMTGVPFTSKEKIDVVLMMDNSNSMEEASVDRVGFSVAAAKAFIEKIAKNEDGTFTGNRIYAATFLGGYLGMWATNSPFAITDLTTRNDEDGYQIIDSQEELDEVLNNIEKMYKGQTTENGTEYAKSLEACYNLLNATKEDGNEQFCVFMSDGIPNVFQGEKTKFDVTANIGIERKTELISMFNISNYTSSNATVTRKTSGYEYEKYSTMMKNNGVDVFTVGLGLEDENASWLLASSRACLQVASYVLNDISGPAGETAADRDTGNVISKENKYFFSVEDTAGAAGMTEVFGNIAGKILEAAKDVKVTDKIADEYTMIFDFPKAEVKQDYNNPAEENPAQDFYIELNEYQLSAVYGEGDKKDQVVDYLRGTSESVMKLYLGAQNGKYFAAKDAAGTAFDAPKFEEKVVGKKYYWSTNPEKADETVPVTVEIEGTGSKKTTYYFVPDGDGELNMVSGAYAKGTQNAETKNGVTVNTPCQDLVLATPYFVYDAATRMLVWTAEKLSNTELALTYFLYLDNSGGFVGTDTEVDADTYPTNDYAYLNYTNFKESECEQEFPIPQMTWNGAQVSYVFYMVNEDGVPVNRAGRPLPFSEAVYVTDVFTHSVIWNKNSGVAGMNAAYLAKEVVPEVYELYDVDAEYIINVYEDENGSNQNNHFTIKGGEKVENKLTTYVFNTKADKTKYTECGIYDKENVYKGFDFANTTVAFAVLWKPELVEDVVVIDYGLPVEIDVAQNDNVAGTVIGLSDDYDFNLLDIAINKGQIVNLRRYPLELSPGYYSSIQYGKAEVISNASVRYTPLTMNLDGTDRFYYISELQYYDESNTLINSYMYSSVTVVPAANIYFEDTTTFVTYTDGTDNGTAEYGKWVEVTDDKYSSAQAQDRPGKRDISAAIDKDNLYGYDKAYENSRTYSLGSAHKVTVSPAQNPKNGGEWPTASFTFTGTAFDILSLTSSQTGAITVNVAGENTGYNKTWIVDTYYGYTYQEDSENPYLKYTFQYGTDEKWHLREDLTVAVKEAPEGFEELKLPAQAETGATFELYEENKGWIVTDDENALYQIPVIKSPQMEYDTYTVTISVKYAAAFNHSPNPEDEAYDFYLDGVRIYNPVKLSDPVNDKTVGKVYEMDGEANPVYVEVRKNLIAYGETTDTVNGAVFIDGLKETSSNSGYKSYGPNNEVYLKKGQAVAFRISHDSIADYAGAHLGVKSPNGDAVKLTVTGVGVAEQNGKEKALEISTKSATELYYNITDCVQFDNSGNSNMILLTNTSESDAIVSITNLKITHGLEAYSPFVALVMDMEDAKKASDLLYKQSLAPAPTEEPVKRPVKNDVTEEFTDVSDDWYTEYVQFVYNNDIMNGNDYKFMPNDTVTRAMVVTTLYRMSGSPEVSDYTACEDLKDVYENQWYTDAICWAYKEGITTGYTGLGLFGVDDAVTREQLAVFFYRYAKAHRFDIVETIDESVLSGLENCDQVNDYAKDAVSWVIGTGVIRGVEKEMNEKIVYDLAPQGNATRAQMATMLTRFCEKHRIEPFV